MLTLSTSQSHDALFQLARAERLLTICELNDLVIPKLLNIPENVSKECKCSRVILQRLDKFKMDVMYVRNYLDKATVLDTHASNLIKEVLRLILDVPFTVAAFTDKIRYKQLDDVLSKLKNCKPSPADARLSPGFVNHKLSDYEIPRILKNESSRVSMNPYFQSPVAFRRINQSYELLEPLHKACLLCFSALPILEDAEINKRTIIYWWIGEELIAASEGENGEEIGHRILEILTDHGFIEDVIVKERATSRCRVRPFIREVLTYLANVSGFCDYLEDREQMDDNVSYGSKRRVCLVKPQEEEESASSYSSFQQLRRGRNSDLECIQTLFNVNKCYLDIKLHWFWKMKGMKALYLGRCNSKAIHHIEVKSTKFLAGMTYMKELRLLSLQGISKIVKLPDSIAMARNLRIMDLRDCNDMEELPETVKSLEKLTHLDLSGCYSLLRLPKGVTDLSELQVLKGFLVREDHQKDRDTCSFQDLSRLKNLIKLTISTSVRSFPAKEHLKVFGEMQKLRKLTIAWRGLYRAESEQQLDITGSLPKALEKLDLQHFPYATAPTWLVPDKLQNLRKLYIKGGKFLSKLSPVQFPLWQVETVRFKYLPQLKMTWLEFNSLFRQLSYLEQVKCPMLSSFPCNDEGVWRKPL
ncbi:hypothetical protein RND81_05G048200 [Saponaria officinalis]|uniref:Disease resistance RPP13-like protein 4 n=1 Tax=Saponaria officinalis TaxID=3572 RepID=A0AAW1KXV3_SAPOF